MSYCFTFGASSRVEITHDFILSPGLVQFKSVVKEDIKVGEGFLPPHAKGLR